MVIGGHLKTSFIDFPDRIATVFFARGCNFRCPWCYNSALVTGDPGEISPRYMAEFLDRRGHCLDGIVVSGGEPTRQADLPEFLAWLGTWKLPRKIDTNGSDPAMLERILAAGLVEYVAMDIKAPWEKYSTLAGTMVDVQTIRKSVELLKTGPVEYEFRTTLVGGLLSPGDIREMAGWLLPARRWALQRFRDHPEVLGGEGRFRSFSEGEIRALAEELGEDTPGLVWR